MKPWQGKVTPHFEEMVKARERDELLFKQAQSRFRKVLTCWLGLPEVAVI